MMADANRGERTSGDEMYLEENESNLRKCTRRHQRRIITGNVKWVWDRTRQGFVATQQRQIGRPGGDGRASAGSEGHAR